MQGSDRSSVVAGKSVHVAEKTFTHDFLCNSVANATLNCIENKYNKSHKNYTRWLQIREANRIKQYKILHEAATRWTNLSKNTNDETDQLQRLLGPDWRKRGEIP